MIGESSEIFFTFHSELGIIECMNQNNTAREDFELRLIFSRDEGVNWELTFCDDDATAFNTLKDLSNLERRAKAWSMLNPDREYKVIMCFPNDMGEPYSDFSPIFSSTEVWKNGYWK